MKIRMGDFASLLIGFEFSTLKRNSWLFLCRALYTVNGKLLVLVGGLDSWDPLMKGIVTNGYP